MTETKQYLVLWSGGCDSTLTLYDALSKYGTENVRALTFIHPQLTGSDIQQKAIPKIKKKLAKQFGNFKSETVTLKCKYQFEHTDGYNQCQFWLFLAAIYSNTTENIIIGYCRGDDAWHYRSNIVDVWTNLQAMNYKSGQILLPLEWETKQTIHNRLDGMGLLNLCVTCVEPKSPCGKCYACQLRAFHKNIRKTK